MPERSALSPKTARWRFWLRSNDDPVKIVIVAILIAFCSAAVVSGTEWLTIPKRLANIEAQRASQMASLLTKLPGLASVLNESGVDSLDTRLVDLAAGQYTTEIELSDYDARAAETDKTLSTELAPEIDIAGIGSRVNFAPVHLLYRDNTLELIILPVHGVGYQSVIRAWLTLGPELNTVVALTIYEQAETPGLGSRITEESWLTQFQGRRLRDNSGALQLKVVKGKSGGEFEIDGITGATRTGNAINRMIEFWLGDAGYGPYLTALQTGTLR